MGECALPLLGGYERLLFDRRTVQQIVLDLAEDAGALVGAVQGEDLHFTWTAGYDGVGGHEVVRPDSEGLYAVGGLWPWARWSPRRPADQAAKITTGLAPEQQGKVSVPVHLAGPGDGAATMRAFVEKYETWTLWAPTTSNAYVAIRECMTSAVKADFEALEGPERRSGWIVTGYEAPLEEPQWHARFDTFAPSEVVRIFLGALEAELEWGSGESGRIADLWSEIGWTDQGTVHNAPDGTCGGITGRDSVTLWGGVPRHRWAVDFRGPVPEAAVLETIKAVAYGRRVLRERTAVPPGHAELIWPESRRQQAVQTTSTLRPPSPAPPATHNSQAGRGSERHDPVVGGARSSAVHRLPQR